MGYPERPQLGASRSERTGNGASAARTDLHKFVAGIRTIHGVTGGVGERPIIEVLVRRSMKLHTALMESTRTSHARQKELWERDRAAIISRHEEGIQDLASITPGVTALSAELDGIVTRLMAEHEYFPHYTNPLLAGMIHHSVVEQLRGSLNVDPVLVLSES